MKYKTTVIKMSIHPETENAIHGDQTIHVSLDDDGAGAYIVIEDIVEGAVLRLDFVELEMVYRVAKKLIRGNIEV